MRSFAARPRWLLGVSLILNAALIAGIAIRLLSVVMARPEELPAAGASRIERLAATLPSEDAARLRAVFAGDAAAVSSAEDAFVAGREAVRSSLRREPFDMAAFEAALGRSTSRRCTLEQILHADLAKAVPGMSAAGRDRLAAWPGSPR